ncbi:MAG TPA: N-acetylmuramoyl-L-alanine amidase [Ruminiclostridium sp.]|nr:N-acetylmuramoyl-L-alanine amidase [Ruminiclostridium sp.]
MIRIFVVFIGKKLCYIFILIVSIILIVTLLFNIHLKIHPVNQFKDPNSEIIVIDPGHGGVDGGTNKDGVLEKVINLDISEKLKYFLELKGYSVIMTREDDISLDHLNSSSKSRHMRDLNARTNIINKSNAQLFLSIHVNCDLKKPLTDGAIVFYNDRLEQNKLLAYSIQRVLNDIKVNGEKRTIHEPVKAKYFVLDKSNIPGVIVETAFISNNRERKEMVTDTFKEETAKALVTGIERYLSESDSVSSPFVR